MGTVDLEGDQQRGQPVGQYRVRKVCRRVGCEVGILPFLTVLGSGRILGTGVKAVGSRSLRLATF